jgi:hypothetical protein
MEPVGLDLINQRVGPWFPRLSSSQRRSNPASGAPRGRYRPWWMTSIISGTVVLLMRGRPFLTPAVTS